MQREHLVNTWVEVGFGPKGCYSLTLLSRHREDSTKKALPKG